MLYSAGRKGKFSVLADWILDVLGNFNLGYLSFFSNKYFLIIIYIKLVPNRLFCWTFFFLFIVLLGGLCPRHSPSLFLCDFFLAVPHVWHSLVWVRPLGSSGNRSGAAVITAAGSSLQRCFVVLITSAPSLPPLPPPPPPPLPCSQAPSSAPRWE